LAAPAVAQAVAPEPRDVDLNFPNAPLESVLKFYAEMTGRTILRPAMLPGNQSISLVSNGRLTRSEAIQALHTVLAMNGVTVLPEGDRFAKAVPSAQALQEGAPFSKIPANDLPEAGQFVTQVVQVTNVLPSELTQILTPFAKTPQGIVPIDSSQTLVLRDFAANVKRMMEVIAKVDIEPPADYKLEVIPIKFGKVDEIYDVMGSLVGTGAGGTTSGAAARAPGTAGTTRGRGSSVRRSSSAMGGSMGGNSMSRGGLQQRGQLGQNAQGQQPGQQTSFQQRLAQLVNRAASGGESQLLQDARIIPDSRANSLVVYANKHDMDVITNVVAKLDVMLAQVLIESAIIDVDLNKNSDFGVSFAQRPKTAGDWTGAGGINNAKDFWGSLSNFPSSLNGGLTYFANYKGDLEMTVKAIANKGTVTVLQKPRILTTHAVPASFFNGKTVPYITSSYYGGVGYGNSSSYQQLEVGIGLEVTPYITPDNLVLMEVNQTIDEISGSVKIDNNDVPTTTSRTASSTVSVRNGETIMLGGYIRSSKTRTRGGVPGLMNVPLVGALFRSNHSESDRSELVVLIRPTVLTTPEAAAKQVEIEKENLPGARLAEREYYETEEAVKRAADKEIKAKDSSKKKGNKQSDDFY
jgi:general secretion pathway protein D